MKMRWLIALLMVGSAGAQVVPRVEGATMSGRAIVLPDAVKGKRAVLVVSFAKSASAECRAWLNTLKGEYPSREAVPVYLILELEDVPKFVRGFVVRAIKKDLGTEGAEIGVPIFSGTEEWKKVVGFAKSDEAYVVVLGADGKIELVVHGDVSVGMERVKAALR